MRFITFCTVLLVCFLFTVSFSYAETVSDETFVVEQHERVGEVAENLQEAGLIDSTFLFRFLWFLAHPRDAVAAGGYDLQPSMNTLEIVRSLEESAPHVLVSISPESTREQIATALGEALGWSEREVQNFVKTYAAIQWDHFNQQMIEVLGELFEWEQAEKTLFAIASARYAQADYDFLAPLYEPGEYLISEESSQAQIAAQLVDRFADEHAPYTDTFLQSAIDVEVAHNIAALVKGEVENIPDLVPLLPRDVDLIFNGGRHLLVFTTTYWNQGEGPFELRADEQTRGVQGDFERDIFQRIYKVDGTWRDRFAGNFLWHEEHLHYHYADFVEYVLEPVDIDGVGTTTTTGKRTFCIRDVEEVDLTFSNALGTPSYEICGKERQGISVGWGDSYFFTYADQNIDITGMPSGTYRLLFDVNPARRFEELSYENNSSSVLLDITLEDSTVEVLDE